MPEGHARRDGAGTAILWPLLLLLASGALTAPAAAQEAAEAATNPMGKMRLVKFENTPFPFDGEIAEKGGRFLDVVQGDRRGHT